MNTSLASTDGNPKSVTFHLASPAARSVALAVFFADWAPNATTASYVMVRHLVRLTHTAPGHWECKLALRPGRHEYAFLVDGKWVLDPEAEENARDGEGGYNSVCRIGAVVEAAPTEAGNAAKLPHSRSATRAAWRHSA